jgi:hypothetical protein
MASIIASGQPHHRSKASFAINANTTTSITTRTKPEPRRSAVLAPNTAPTMFAAASTPPNHHHTCPPAANTTNAPRFVPAFTNFAIAEPCRKSAPTIVVNANTRNVPVPGPTRPS